MYAAAGPGPSPSSVEPESEWSSKGETARQATADQWGAAESEGVNALTPPPRLTYVITQGASSSALDLTGMAGLAAVQHHLASFHRGGVATPQLSSGGSDDGGSPPSPGTTTTTPPPSPSPGGVGAGKDRSSPLLETPTRKNKRKLSEPRKRGGGGGGGGTDFSIKRLCTDSPGGSAMSESGCSDDGGEADSHRGRRVRRRLSHDDSASSRGLSEREDTPVPGGSSSGGGGGGGGAVGGGGGRARRPVVAVSTAVRVHEARRDASGRSVCRGAEVAMLKSSDPRGADGSEYVNVQDRHHRDDGDV